MPRTRPHDRLEKLVAAATDVFIASGYRRAQIADVAKVLGVAKGTVYLYVPSKAALLDLALRHAAEPERPLPLPARLPIDEPRAGATAEFVRERLSAEPRLAELLERLNAPVVEPDEELEAITRTLYALMSRYRVALKLLDRCATEFPDLADIFRGVARDGIPLLLERYIQRGIEADRLRDVPDAKVAGRMIMETISTWAIHIHWDHVPRQYDEEAIELTLVELTRGLLLR